MPKPEQSDSPRPRKKKKGRSSSNRWVLPVAFVVVALAAGTGAFFLVKTLIFGGSGGTAATTWPLPPGTPVEQLYGKIDEPIDSCTFETLMNPLRRRSTDPLVVLSNPRIGESKIWKKPVLLIDIKVPENLGTPRSIMILAVPVPAGRSFRVPRSVHGIESVGRFSSTTIEVEIFDPFRGNDSPPTNPNLEIWAEVSDSRYLLSHTARRSNGTSSLKGSASFKVSPSVFLGSPGSPKHSRDWHPDELTFLQTAGGEKSVEMVEGQ